MDRVFGIAVAEVILDQPEVMTLVGQVIAAGVAERMGVNALQACASRVREKAWAERWPGVWFFLHLDSRQQGEHSSILITIETNLPRPRLQ
jgi:hypothetical protein